MIRKITAADFDFIYELYMHPQVNPFLLYEQMNEDEFMPVFTDLLHKNIIYIFTTAGTDVGMFKFILQEYRNHHTAYLGGLAIHPEFSGKGYGGMMMQQILALGKTNNIVRIELSVSVYNHKAISLYEKAGFQKEGILRKYTHLVSENRYIDEQLMSYLY